MAEQTNEDRRVLSIEGPSGSCPAPLPPPDTILPPPDNCVICLDHISEKAIALPCRHDQFDFPCLGTWLQRQQVCPLCKGTVTAIRFNAGDQDEIGSRIFYLPAPEHSLRGGEAAAAAAVRRRRFRHARPHSRAERAPPSRPISVELKDTALSFRRHVYRQKLYSLHVGTNRISRYRNLTPSSFAKDEHLTSRARMWIRRELQVFDFLNPDLSPLSGSTSTDRRASNADFLLEYIIAILKSIDLKGSTGQAEELLKDFLGRENARLFLHELEAWLRSPYERLADWDRMVQYVMPTERAEGDDMGTRSHQRSTSLCEYVGSSRSFADAPSVPRWFSERFVLGNEMGPTTAG